MNNVMLDLETMSTEPNAAIVAIGAVLFNRVGIGESFYIQIDLASSVENGGHMSASTVNWWLKQDDDARAIFGSQRDGLKEALHYFSNWLEPIEDVKVWGNGSDFDNVILKSAYENCNIKLPWKYYNNRCYKTIKSLSNISLVRQGTYHNALDDARSQANHLIAIVNELGIKL